MAEFGHIDILVNNAGLIRREDAINFSERDWDDVMDLNIKSVFHVPCGGKALYRAGERRQDREYCLHARSVAVSACRLTPPPKAP